MTAGRHGALVAVALAVSLGLSSLMAQTASAAGLPNQAAQAGDYLAAQLHHKTINGHDTAYVAYVGTTPNLSLTAEAVIAFHALGRTADANLVLRYLQARVEDYVHVESGCGSSGPYDDAGHLGLVLYIAHLTNSQSGFDITGLKNRLLGLERMSGANIGLFGSNSPKACFDGVQRTSFAVIGLLSSGMPASDPAISAAMQWLTTQQCPNGAFPAYRAPGAPCATSGWGPDRFDTNSTAYAVLAAVAAGASSAAGQPLAAALSWLAKVQRSDATWGMYKGDTGDSDSTSLVTSALVAAGQLAPSQIGTWTKAGVTPYRALATFQDPASKGIFWQAGSLPDNLSTIEGITALSAFEYVP